MFVMGNLIEAVAIILDRVLQIYSWVVMIAVLVSWVNPDPFNPVMRFLRAATEPAFAALRRALPFLQVGMIDLSPIALFFLIWFLRMFLVTTLIDIGLRLR
jgi:YggT family protein